MKLCLQSLKTLPWTQAYFCNLCVMSVIGKQQYLEESAFLGKSKACNMEMCQQFCAEDLGRDRETVVGAGGSFLICRDYSINVLPICDLFKVCWNIYCAKCCQICQRPPVKKRPCRVGFEVCLEVNFWRKFVLGDNKMMTLLPKYVSGSPPYCLLVWKGNYCKKVSWIAETREKTFLCLDTLEFTWLKKIILLCIILHLVLQQ